MPNPRYVTAQPTAEVDRGLMQRQFRSSRPQLKLIAATPATMATVASHCHVHRERAVTTAGVGVVQRTAPYHCDPDRLVGSNPSKLSTCSIVARERTRRKSTPGTANLPAAPTLFPLWCARRTAIGERTPPCSGRPFRSLSLYERNWNGLPSADQPRHCQPPGVRPSRPARSSDSSASPRALVLDPE